MKNCGRAEIKLKRALKLFLRQDMTFFQLFKFDD